MNGDAFGDLLKGAPGIDAGLPDEGAAIVFHGSSNGIESSPAWMVTSGQSASGIDLSLIGLKASAQGIVFGRGYTFCNAYRLTVGY